MEAVSRHGTLLPIPEDLLNSALTLWPIYEKDYPHPRSKWLSDLEAALLVNFPQSSSADRKLTARHYAPFPLALGPNVP